MSAKAAAIQITVLTFFLCVRAHAAGKDRNNEMGNVRPSLVLKDLWGLCTRLLEQLGSKPKSADHPISKTSEYHPDLQATINRLIAKYRVSGIELNPHTLKRLDQVFRVFNEANQLDPDKPFLGIKHILEDRNIVPEKGVIHVVGPGDDHYEWVIPLLCRRDATIIVSEPNEHHSRVFTDPKELERVFDTIGKYQPSVVEGLNFEDLKKEVAQRIWLIPDVRQHTFEPGQAGSIHPFSVSTPIPRGDLILAISPYQGGIGYGHQAKPGSVFWVRTEAYPPTSRYTVWLKSNRVNNFNAITVENREARWDIYHIGDPLIAVQE